MWTPLQKLIPQTAGKYSFATSLKAIEVCQAYRAVAPTILPKDILQNASPKSYQNGTLTIAVHDSLWAQQIQMKKHTLIQLINNKFQQTAENQQKMSHKLTPQPKMVQNIRIVMVEKAEDLDDFLDSQNITAIN